MNELQPEEPIRLPDVLPEPRFGQLGSGLYARIRDEAGRDHWRSPSAALIEVPADAADVALGDCVLIETGLGGAPAFQYQCALAWEDLAGNTLPFRLTVWRDQAEAVAESLTKGTRVIVTGRLEQRSWETQEGDRRSIVEVAIDEVGPSLRWATASVTRTARSGGGDFGGGSSAPPPGPVARDDYGPDEAPF